MDEFRLIRKLGWHLLAVLVLTSSNPAFAKNEACPDYFAQFSIWTRKELRQSQSFVAGNAFVTDRNLADYLRRLPAFAAALARLPANGVWMDVGAGQAIALREAAAAAAGNDGKRFFAFGVTIPEHVKADITKATEVGNFKYVEGKFEAQNLAVLPKANIITDVFGAVSYSPQLDQVLEKSLTQLAPNGQMFLQIHADSFKIMTGMFSHIDLPEYLARVKGIEVVSVDRYWGRIEIRRTDGPISTPKLKLRKVRDGAPPKWTYSIVK